MENTKKKKYRPLTAKPGIMKAQYGVLYGGENPEMCFIWGDGISKAEVHILYNLLGNKQIELIYGKEKEIEGRDWKFGKTALEKLDEAGFDITTLKFSIEKKKILE